MILAQYPCIAREDFLHKVHCVVKRTQRSIDSLLRIFLLVDGLEACPYSPRCRYGNAMLRSLVEETKIHGDPIDRIHAMTVLLVDVEPTPWIPP